MLRATLPLQRSYRQRSMEVPHRWYGRKFMQRFRIRKGPFTNKTPEEYSDRDNWKTGFAWKDRMLHRGSERHWPWVSWHDDPVGRETERSNPGRRTFSVSVERSAVPIPRYNVYEIAKRDFRASPALPLVTLAPILHSHVGDRVQLADCEKHLTHIAGRFPTALDVAKHGDELVDWCTSTADVPIGVAHHVRNLCSVLIAQQARKHYRQMEHLRGVLRTNSMERYYAAPPVVTGPFMPQELAQPAHRLATPYRKMMGGFELHESILTRRSGRDKYPV
jgi:hypothetical protein